MSDYDLLIIGGGINGAAIAREAALNGLKVLLVEKNDLASGTSSASTKLIHGGLRYLEYYEFKLVREGLIERERLLKAAPHLIYPLEFVLPHQNTLRPRWMIRAGLFLYDHLGGRISLPRSRAIGAKDRAFLAPLSKAKSGFVYSDAWVDDARLVVLNARDAADNGAEVRTRTELISARRDGGVWRAMLSGGEVTARALVNAAGPWIGEVEARLGVNAKARVRLVRGSHIIVPRLFAGEHAYILQQPDRRIVFAIPYRNETTLIGTTDIPVDDPGAARIGEEETDYLLAAVNRYFTKQLLRADIVSTFAGIRSLYDDGASEARQVTRDYVLELDADGPPLLSVFGGKITTARHLAEVAVGKLARALNIPFKPATLDRRFPGGDLFRSVETYSQELNWQWPQIGDARLRRWVRAYGSLIDQMMADRFTLTDPMLGEEFGAGLTAREVDWLVEREWARSVEDILWRRTKLGLTGEVDEARLQAYLDRR
ncbi:glycerol-3-phosphate dehydrogenase [Sphingomonas tabacisoli]|uniref:Glycerol-3-phosphate dehydrogenase n=1 Tax=Sphingomonas tabacisoli TaxID=2249466 RepID=A0ABW4I9E4_9SPHN